MLQELQVFDQAAGALLKSLLGNSWNGVTVTVGGSFGLGLFGESAGFGTGVYGTIFSRAQIRRNRDAADAGRE